MLTDNFKTKIYLCFVSLSRITHYQYEQIIVIIIISYEHRQVIQQVLMLESKNLTKPNKKS